MNAFRNTSILVLLSLGVIVAASGRLRGADTQPADKGDGKTFSVQMGAVNAWSDHMPMVGAHGSRQYLVVAVEFTNHTQTALSVDLSEAHISFAADDAGPAVKSLFVRDAKTGEAQADVTAVTVPAGQSLKVEYRGVGLYDTGKEGQTIYVTLKFAAGAEALTARGSGAVQRTD